MPVYNVEKYLQEAIESILNQTYSNFEFLIINDGSSDKSGEIINSYNDSRIVYLQNNKNKGLVYTLNYGISLAKGEYIARMDGDDISLPDRFETQVAIMGKFKDIVVCGSWMKTFGLDNECIWSTPTQDALIKASLVFASCIYHPTTMFRRETLIKNRLNYDPKYIHAEDYELWIRLADFGELANISQVLLKYRKHTNSVGSKHSNAQRQSANKIRNNLLSSKLQCSFSKKQFRIHEAFCYRDFNFLKTKKQSALAWLNYLEHCNDRSNFTSMESMRFVIDDYRNWFRKEDSFLHLNNWKSRLERLKLKRK
ncbi:MAG: glycosyltransferase family 2 protein [Prolixibacteraceae bacterium]|nr:glycosyltransferase family 2 protein [Prolixibacteraceae bacterium]MBT6997061.1 glycosyltransferase family 2 protein [Prolixibacteraceae bacterium]MBT7396341.1 glycosyltransferase family 2 protein [Prolixibacteraceae bacterium]